MRKQSTTCRRKSTEGTLTTIGVVLWFYFEWLFGQRTSGARVKTSLTSVLSFKLRTKPTMLGVVASLLAVVCKRMQQLPTMLGQKKCWELLAPTFDRFQTLSNNSQEHSTTCTRVCKLTQHVTSNNVGNCQPTVLRSIARSFSKTCSQENRFHFDWNISLTILGSKETNQFSVAFHLCRTYDIF